MPHWLGIPAVILLIGMIIYGFRQWGRIKDPNREPGGGANFDPPPDSSSNHHG